MRNAAGVVLFFAYVLFLTPELVFSTQEEGSSIQLPRPSGKYSVGTIYKTFVDSSRSEIFTDDPSDFREVSCRIWYPASTESGAECSDYIPEAERIVSQFKLPKEICRVTTNSFVDAAPVDSNAPFPVLIYSHGWGEYAEHYSTLTEDLASHGFVVLSVGHHYEAKFWRTSTGRIATITEGGAALTARMNEQRSDEAFSLFETMPFQETRHDQRKLVKKSTELMPLFFSESPRVWSEDISFAIDQLHRINAYEGILKDRLDLSRIGVLGMSMGGIASALVCVADKRIAAGANLDGGLYGDVIDKTIITPFMFVNSSRYLHYTDFFLDHLVSGSAIVIRESDHLNFSDLPLLNYRESLTGPIDGRRMLEIVRVAVREFFDRTLRIQSDLRMCEVLQGFPEVTCKSKE